MLVIRMRLKVIMMSKKWTFVYEMRRQRRNVERHSEDRLFLSTRGLIQSSKRVNSRVSRKRDEFKWSPFKGDTVPKKLAVISCLQSQCCKGRIWPRRPCKEGSLLQNHHTRQFAQQIKLNSCDIMIRASIVQSIDISVAVSSIVRTLSVVLCW